MTEDARMAAERAEKKSKKRKGEGKGKSGKRSKKNNGASVEALKSAQDKDAKTRKDGKKIIFTQPSNLSKGCILKDYQLEGVRWLASLFENGVSGILADEVRALFSIVSKYAATRSISHGLSSSSNNLKKMGLG